MYLRPAFVETDLACIVGLIEAHPFGLLVTHGGGGLDGSHLPFTVRRDGDALVLDAHLAAANAQCAALDGTPALVVFAGPHAYIAPSWYETQPSVPTWDYAAVHVHGVLQPVADPAESLTALAVGDPGGFDHADLSDTYRAAMFRGIRAFRLRSDRIEAQWKMSQNRSATDRRRVVAALRVRGEVAVADLIEATIG